MNEILLVLTIVATFSMMLLMFRLFGKIGIFVWAGFATIFANIEVVKIVQIFGLETALGNVMFGTTFLATDILSECYGKKEARKAVHIGLVMMLVFFALLQLSLLFVPSPNDFANEPMHKLFALSPRVFFASTLLYLLANHLDILIYSKLKQWFPKQLWLRNNVATVICQSSQAFLFAFISFYGTMPVSAIVQIAVTGIIFETLVAFCDTPFLYWARHMKKKHNID